MPVAHMTMYSSILHKSTADSPLPINSDVRTRDEVLEDRRF